MGLTPQRRNKQPFSTAPLNARWLSRGLTSAVNLATGYDAVLRKFWTITGLGDLAYGTTDYGRSRTWPDFPATQDYFTSPITDASSTAVSVVAVVRATSRPGSGNACILVSTDATQVGSGTYELNLDASGLIKWTNPGVHDLGTGTNIVPLGVTSVIGAVLGGAGERCETYINGRSDLSSTAAFPLNNTFFAIGSVYNNKIYSWLGDISDVFIFSGTALTKWEMLALTARPYAELYDLRRTEGLYASTVAVAGNTRNFGQFISVTP